MVTIASALCRQDSVLTNVAPDSASGAVEASAIDREATRRGGVRELFWDERLPSPGARVKSRGEADGPGKYLFGDYREKLL
jgi:hypothetical protein